MKSQDLVAVVMALSELLLLSPTASAQTSTTGAIAGSVRDTTSGVLPGVGVEAASDALIERVRSVVSDAQGQYKIVDLRPGIYTLTFTLPGFSTVKRDGVQLSVGITANVSVELAVGDMQETITVSGAAPLVDIQNVSQQRVVTREILDNLPTAKTIQNMAVLTPGVVVAGGMFGASSQDVGGTQGDRGTFMSVHGSRGNEMPLLLDGMKYNNTRFFGGGFTTLFKINSGIVEEMSIETSGASVESDVSGVRISVIPKEGGNSFHGSVYGTYTNDKLQADNLTEEWKSQNISVSTYRRVADFVGTGGGPLKRETLWFFAAFRANSIVQLPPGVYYSKDPAAFVYTPDLDRPAETTFDTKSVNARLTWQVSPKNRVGMFADKQPGCACPSNLSTLVGPEAATNLPYIDIYIAQATWRSMLTKRLMLDVGATWYNQYNSWKKYLPDLPDRLPVQELSTGRTLRSPISFMDERNRNYNGKASVNYVTGSHAFKAGTQWQTGYSTIFNNSRDTVLVLLNGKPSSVQIQTTPYTTESHQKLAIGLFAQDQWTLGRATFNLGIRMDHLNAYAAALNFTPVRYVGARNFPEVPNSPNWNDVVPRLGVAWDVFGNGKTALKASISKYVLGMGAGIAEQVSPFISTVNQTTRPWNDDGDFTPQESELGPLANANFGRTIVTRRFDPDFLEGWGKRPFNWEVTTGLQHELRPGFAVNAAYFRHWSGNFWVINNRAVSPADYDPYCITTPINPQLPGGGGQALCGLYNINPSKFGQFDELVTFAKNFGNQTEVYNGVDLALNLRLPGGVLLQGGTGTGRTVSDNCDVVGKIDNAAGPPNAFTQIIPVNQAAVASPSTLYCRVAPPIQTQVKVLGVYPLPWWGLQASATIQSLPGPEITAIYPATTAEISSSLGRNLAGGQATANVSLIPSGSRYGDRLNQVDVRLTKTVRVARGRIQGQFDLYNLFNANPLITFNTRYGPAWLAPTNILSGRTLKFGVQLDL